jgi:hypothetical protein
MKRTLLGSLFLLVGLGILAAALVPVGAALWFHQPVTPISTPFLGFLLAGVAVAVFGAWMIPNSGADVTFNQIIFALGSTSLPWVGGKRKDDPPAPPKGGAS